MEKLGLPHESFDGGWNVGTYCLALAKAMGCGPIYLAGMDLAFTGGRAYAAGVQEEKEREGSIQVQNSKGEQMWTRKDWFMAALWIEDFARDHPDLELINATKGGLGFKGLPQKDLKDIPHTSKNLRQIIHFLVENLPPVSLQDPEPIIEELRASWERCENYCERILQCFQKYFPQTPDQKGDYVLAEVEFFEEIAYQKILEPVWIIWKPVFDRKILEPIGKQLNQFLFFKRILKEGRNLWS